MTNKNRSFLVHYELFLKYLIYNEGKQRETLYDLQNDPGEMVNLAGDPKYKTELNYCRRQLIEWAKNNNDPYLSNMIK